MARESPRTRNRTGCPEKAPADTSWSCTVRGRVARAATTRLGRAAAVAVTVVPATTTATVTAMATSAGPAAVTRRQNTPSITGRSTR